MGMGRGLGWGREGFGLHSVWVEARVAGGDMVIPFGSPWGAGGVSQEGRVAV